MKKRIAVSVALVVAVFGPMAVFAAEAVTRAAGVVIDITGSAQVSSTAGQMDGLSEKSRVYAGDSITTADGASVKIQYSDGSITNLGSNTEYRIDNYQFNNQGEGVSGKLQATLTRGELSMVGGAIHTTQVGVGSLGETLIVLNNENQSNAFGVTTLANGDNSVGVTYGSIEVVSTKVGREVLLSANEAGAQQYATIQADGSFQYSPQRPMTLPIASDSDLALAAQSASAAVTSNDFRAAVRDVLNGDKTTTEAYADVAVQLTEQGITQESFDIVVAINEIKTGDVGGAIQIAEKLSPDGQKALIMAEHQELAMLSGSERQAFVQSAARVESATNLSFGQLPAVANVDGALSAQATFLNEANAISSLT